MEDLLLLGKSQMKAFEVQNEDTWVSSIFDYLQQHFSYLENYQIEYHNRTDLKLYTDEDVLKTICRNLTANAINALEEKENKKIIWEAYTVNDLKVLKITDFCGANKENFQNLYTESENVGIKNGLGLHLIRELSKSLNITIEIETSKSKTEIILNFQT